MRGGQSPRKAYHTQRPQEVEGQRGAEQGEPHGIGKVGALRRNLELPASDRKKKRQERSRNQGQGQGVEGICKTVGGRFSQSFRGCLNGGDQRTAFPQQGSGNEEREPEGYSAQNLVDEHSSQA